MNWEKMSEDELWHTLCLCLLSSQVPYDKALRTIEALAKSGLIDRRFLVTDEQAEEKVEASLRLSHYRFPKSKAKSLVKTARNLEGRSLQRILASCLNDRRARNLFAQEVHGFGMKQASHFLRDIGFTEDLAIIDTHIIKFLVEKELISKPPKTLTRRRYLTLEKVFIEYAEKQGLSPADLDRMIWQRSRR